jgi:hypothetical protein
MILHRISFEMTCWSPNNNARRTSSSCADVIQGSFRGYAIGRELVKFLQLPAEFSGASSPTFWCPLHEDGERPSAWLRRTERGDILFNCSHEGGWSLTLPQFYASICTGTIVQFKDDGKAEKVSHVVWRLRLLHDAGLIKPLPRKHRDVPVAAPPSVGPVWRGFLLLLGLKDHIPQWKGNPAAYSWRFISVWCGVTVAEARYAMKWLLEHGYLEGTKLDKKMYGRAMEVFQPSDQPYTPVPLRELRGVTASLLEECDADHEDCEPEAISVVSRSVGLVAEDRPGDQWGVLAERHPSTPHNSGVRHSAPDPTAPVRVWPVRKSVRGQVRAEIPSKVPQPEVEAASNAEVRAFWATRVPAARVDSGTGDVYHRG